MLIFFSSKTQYCGYPGLGNPLIPAQGVVDGGKLGKLGEYGENCGVWPDEGGTGENCGNGDPGNGALEYGEYENGAGVQVAGGGVHGTQGG